MKIAENNKRYLKDFICLNEEWIRSYFEIEQVDIELAKDPSRIIEEGGYIFSIINDEKIVGVCALMNHGDGVYELARMAVSSPYQGRGYGSLLVETCLKKLESIKAEKVYLVSNTKLETAISLYKKYGFDTVSKGSHSVYSRANIVMERDTF